jgi:hypothetical protein
MVRDRNASSPWNCKGCKGSDDRYIADRLGGHIQPADGFSRGFRLPARRCPARARHPGPRTKIIRGILEGIGLRRDGSESISYGERAPLVLPPTHTLPPPEKSDAALTNNPAWPKDPDVSRRKLEAQQERNRNISEEREREQNPLRPDQLTPGGNPRTARRSQGDSYTATPGDRLSAKEMNQKTSIWSSMFGSKDDEVAKFTREPPRAALTEPPPGYQTPSPEQPYGVGKEKPKTKTSADYILEHAAGEQR